MDDEYAALLNTPLTIPAPGFLAKDIDLDGDELTAIAILDGSNSTDPEDDPLTYTWWENDKIIAGPTMVAQSEVMLASRPYTIVLKLEDEIGNSDSSKMRVNFLDTISPVVSAAFDPVFDIGFIQLYKLYCTANDLCDENLTTISVIDLPGLTDFKVSFKYLGFQRIKVFSEEKEIIVESPDPEALWTQILSAGGIPVKDNQLLTILAGPKDVYCYNLNFKGKLKSIIGHEALLRCTATDDSENSSTAIATPPNNNLLLKSVVAVSNPNQKNNSQEMNAIPLISDITKEGYKLEQNYPNPFSRITTIRYKLPEPGSVQIDIIDHLGNIIKTTADQSFPSGWHEIKWNSDGFPAGVYYYKIQAGDFSKARKMVLIR